LAEPNWEPAVWGATLAAIDLAALTPVFQKQALRLCYAYPQLAAVQKILHRLEARPVRESFGAEVEQVVEMRAERVEEAQRLLREACAGKILIKTTVFA
jgi:putative IMPACT (imprinted ancient) family translation regulator